MSDGYHIQDEVQQRGYDRKIMRRLLTYVRPFRKLMVTATFLLLLSALLSNVAPLLYMRAIDWYVNNPERVELQDRAGEMREEGEAAAGGDAAAPELPAAVRRAEERDQRALSILVLVIGGLMLGEAVVRYFQMVIIAYVGQKTMLEMRLEIFAHLQKMSLRFLDSNPVGRLMTRVTNDVEKIQETIVTGVVRVISDLFSIVVVLGFMLWINWRLALITLTTVPFVLVTSLIFRKYARKSYFAIRGKIARLNAYTQENISGMREVQIFGREDKNYEEYRSRNADHRDEWIRQIRNFAIYFPVIDFLGSVSIALIILYGGHQILTNQAIFGGQAGVGMFFAYVQWAERLFGPIRALADRYNLLLEAMASSERVFGLLDTPEEIVDKPDAVPCSRVQGAVDFKDVWFAYEPGQWVLKGIDLRIAPGERVAIVGHTGAGKTTLINLLSRFYDVQRGSITVDGVDVRDYEKVSLRRNIGIVLQDVFLFSGPVGDNIRLGNRALSEDDVRGCAEYVNAAHFINKLPGQYGYDVGERGCNISMGQRQLVAFARTLAHDPQILVLDDATSSVDVETEALIQDAIAKLMEGRTCIVIAHRLSTVQHADRIIVMHHGTIREIGTHQQLLQQRGLYYTLYQLQYKDQQVVA